MDVMALVEFNVRIQLINRIKNKMNFVLKMCHYIFMLLLTELKQLLNHF